MKINSWFNSEITENMFFDGTLEISVIKPMKKIIIPELLVPFSKREYVKDKRRTFVCFFEDDKKFTGVLSDPAGYVEDFSRFGGIITPDCSLAVTAPLAQNIWNIYVRNAIGAYFQNAGIPVISDPRWSDQRTYKSGVLRDPVAFLGSPYGNIVCIGSYGCVRSEPQRSFFKAGLREMLAHLRPKVVLVYGPMPDDIFKDFAAEAVFVHYKDWTSLARRRS